MLVGQVEALWGCGSAGGPGILAMRELGEFCASLFSKTLEETTLGLISLELQPSIRREL